MKPLRLPDAARGEAYTRRTEIVAQPEMPAAPRQPWPPLPGANLVEKVDAAERHLRTLMAGTYAAALFPLYEVVRELAEYVTAIEDASKALL